VALKRLNEAPPPLSTPERPIPPPLEAVVMKALARDPAQRYPDAAAFGHALRNWPSQDETAAMAAAPAVVAAAVVPPPLPPEPPVAPATAATPPPKKRQPWWIWVLAILAVILLGAMGFLAAQLLRGDEPSPSPSAATFELPDWEGEPITAVRLQADSLGLDLDEEPEFSDEVPEDSVVRTEPDAGTMVSEGDTIIVFVSGGEETVAVPALIGQTRQEANITLTQAGLRLGNVDEEFSDRPEGTVIRSNPSAGNDVPLDSQVDIVLSRGPEPTPTPVPTPPPTPTPPPPTPTPAPTPGPP
jgi:serine/threonine-protein kinase